MGQLWADSIWGFGLYRADVFFVDAKVSRDLNVKVMGVSLERVPDNRVVPITPIVLGIECRNYMRPLVVVIQEPSGMFVTKVYRATRFVDAAAPVYSFEYSCYDWDYASVVRKAYEIFANGL